MEASSTSELKGTRRVLGDLSPNVKNVKPSLNSIEGKTLTGSPLKRSFTASIEGGHGFTYLKKRKLSVDRSSAQGSNESGREHGLTVSQSKKPEGVSRQVREGSTGQIDVPSIQQLSPTEPNTPSPSSSPEEGNDSSAERKSFSSLINYEPSSQNPPKVRPKLVFDGPSYAEMLRLRLRVAMFKVRTNQVDIPFAELQVDNTQDHKDTRPSIAQVEEVVAALRREAQLKDSSIQREPIPALLPAPTLRPTAFSSRTISGWRIPSSPPIVESSDNASPPSTVRRSDESCPTESGVGRGLSEGPRDSL